MRKPINHFYAIYRSAVIHNATKSILNGKGLKTGENLLFYLICGLIEDYNYITLREVIIINRDINNINNNTTSTFYKNLKKLGLVISVREGRQFFKPSYIVLTDTGNLLKGIIKDHLNFNPHDILTAEKARQQENKIKAYSKRQATKARTMKMKGASKGSQQGEQKTTF
jgi:hypothetical protein